MKVDVYRNLHNGMYSIKSREAGTRGLVIAHADRVWLNDVEFIVSEAGRNRVLREKKKYVHAFVRGTLSSFFGMVRDVDVDLSKVGEWTHMEPNYVDMLGLGYNFTYNPYAYSTFIDRDTEQALRWADSAFLSTKHGTKYLPSEGIYMGGAGRL